MFANRSEEDGTVTSVVNQGEPGGMQYARRAVVPPGLIREAEWPLFVRRSREKGYEFQFMNLNTDGGRETIQKTRTNESLDGFVTSNLESPTAAPCGFCGTICSENTPAHVVDRIDRLLFGLRTAAGVPNMLAELPNSRAVDGEATLGPFRQIAIADETLHYDQNTCEAIRLWVERGGGCILFLPYAEEATTRALLGEAMPFTIVNRTNPMTLPLTYEGLGGIRVDQIESYERTFDEPVDFFQTIIDRGDVIWSVDDWPVLIRVRFGKGIFFVSTVSPKVFLRTNDGREPARTAARLQEELFVPKNLLTIPEDVFAKVAHSQIGYAIPNRSIPMLVLVAFAALLGIAGWILKKTDRLSWLALAAPVLGLVAAIPGLALGMKARTTAPATLLQTQLIQTAPGQTAFAADGITTIYQPDSGEVSLKMNDFASILPKSEKQTNDSRLTWTDVGTCEWPDLTQPAGITDYSQSTVGRLNKPLTAKAEFRESGLRIRLSNSDVLKPEDLMIASTSPERMAVRSIGEGLFESTTSDVLGPGQTSNESLVSADQVRRRPILENLLVNDRSEPFPQETSLLFWSKEFESTIDCELEGMRRGVNSLCVLPLQLVPPEAGEEVTIPAPLLPYYVIPDATGAVSSAYSASRRVWINRQVGGQTVMRFDIPRECRPFQFSGATLSVRILAGSRHVKFSAGQVGDFTLVDEKDSPVGTFDFELPSDALNAASSEAVFVNIAVGEVGFEKSEDSSPQDDTWLIERVVLNVRGQKIESVSGEKN